MATMFHNLAMYSIEWMAREVSEAVNQVLGVGPYEARVVRTITPRLCETTDEVELRWRVSRGEYMLVRIEADLIYIGERGWRDAHRECMTAMRNWFGGMGCENLASACRPEIP